MSVLPDRPSELIRIALADLRKVEADNRYTVSMGSWHTPEDGVCHVCLAGAVMAGTLGSDPSKLLGPHSGRFEEEDANKLNALDDFRSGCISAGLNTLGRRGFYPDLPEFMGVIAYGVDHKGFHAGLEAIAAKLESVGL